MAYKRKIFKAVNLTLHVQYTYACRVYKVTGINTEIKICLPKKNTLVFIDDKEKHGCQLHSTDVCYCWAQNLLAYLFFYINLKEQHIQVYN